jgi:sulfur-carrier protein
MIRVVLPQHLRTLARVDGEALERTYPVLQGTMRDHVTLKRRPFVRFYACEQDMSHDAPDARLPEAVASGAEPFLVVGAMAGGERG